MSESTFVSLLSSEQVFTDVYVCDCAEGVYVYVCTVCVIVRVCVLSNVFVCGSWYQAMQGMLTFCLSLLVSGTRLYLPLLNFTVYKDV